MIKVSVIIPCYNRVNTIGKAIESVLSQTYSKSIEIIVSDDGSTDGSVEMVREKYPDVKIVLKGKDCKDQGASGARNRGILIATGEYVSFLDSDDYYLPNFMQSLCGFLDDNNEFGYAYCRVRQSIFNPSTNSTVESSWTHPRMNYLRRTYHVLYKAKCIWTGCIVVRREIINKVGLFDRDLVVGEDSDMWIRISEVSKGKYIDEVGSVYCISGYVGNQLTSKEDNVSKRNCALMVLKNAEERYIKHKLHDSVRLLLIKKGIITLSLTQRSGIIFTIYRKCIVNISLFVSMPLTFFKYLFLWNRG